MKRVLMTGGTGFVGANLARRLVGDGHEVHLLVRSEHNPWRIEAIRSSVQLHVAGLNDVDDLVQTVAVVRPDWIFHLAAYGAYPTQTDFNQMVQANVVGTSNFVQACVAVGFEAFVNAGSSSEYGFKDHPPNEGERVEPNSYYAITKTTATLFCQHSARVNNLSISTLRLYSAYGPLEEPTRLMPALIVLGMRGELPDLVDPETVRDFVYVADVTNAVALASP